MSEKLSIWELEEGKIYHMGSNSTKYRIKNKKLYYFSDSDMEEYRVWMESSNAIDYINDKVFTEIKPEPKLVEHYPAVYKMGDVYAHTMVLYHSEEVAKRIVDDFIRLATEYPAIMLEVKE